MSRANLVAVGGDDVHLRREGLRLGDKFCGHRFVLQLGAQGESGGQIHERIIKETIITRRNIKFIITN